MSALKLSAAGAAALDTLCATRRLLASAPVDSAERVIRGLLLAEIFDEAQAVAATDRAGSARVIHEALELVRPDLKAALADERAWEAHLTRLATRRSAADPSRARRQASSARWPWQRATSGPS